MQLKKLNNILVIGGSGFVGSKLIFEIDIKNIKNLDTNKSPFFSKITTIGNILNK